jgi:FkbM family methyltransferase
MSGKLEMTTMSPDTDVSVSMVLEGKRRELVFPILGLMSAFAVFLRYPVVEYSEQPGLVIDVGACVGAFSVAIRESLPNCKIIAFEPYLPVIDYLHYNCSPMSNMEIHHWAVMDESKEVFLSLPTSHPVLGNSSVYGSNIEGYPAWAITLDDFIQEAVSFIKIDVEGAELDVLRGAERILRNDKPPVMVELKNEHQRRANRTTIEVFDYMTSIGYNKHELYTSKDFVFIYG